MGFSFWEQQTWFKDADVCIIGAGIVGLSTAFQLKKDHPHLHILVLEQGMLPQGASTKNAGFACFGSLSELAKDLDTMAQEEVFALMELRIQGLERLKANLGIEAIDYQGLGGFELFRAEESSLYERSLSILSTMNAFLKDRFHWEDVFQQADHQIAKTGMRGFEHMIVNRAEGQINTGKMMHRLLHQCRQLGVEILFSTPVESIQQESSGYRLAIHRTESIKAKQVVITTNGFARQFLPEEDVIPARAQVLVTKPIPELKFQGCYHMDEGYYYFRAIGNRVLFGGGRNLDKAGETTISQETTPLIQDRLTSMLQEYILPNEAFEIETRWAGTMGIGASKMPIVKQTASGIFVGVRMGGMGVAIGSEIAQQLAQKIERVL